MNFCHLASAVEWQACKFGNSKDGHYDLSGQKFANSSPMTDSIPETADGSFETWGLMKFALVFAVALGCVAVEPAVATSFVDYRYDARGRLTSVCKAHSGSGFLTRYALDSAGNRTNVEAANRAFTLASGAELFSADGRFVFAMQTDGNLVLYGPNGSMWTSNTFSSVATFLAFQSDGNLVIYKSDGTGSIWSSGTASNCASLTVQNDGNVVIYSATGASVWSTNTGGH